MINRREFVKKSSMGISMIPIIGFTGCGTGKKEQGTKISGGRVIDAIFLFHPKTLEIHVISNKMRDL